MLRLLATLLLISSSSFAADITGKVYIEKNGASLSKIPVRMHVYKDNFEFSGAETVTDRSGRYSFRNLTPTDQFSYIIYPIYEGVNYPYKEVAFEKTPSIRLDFPISESTGSVENIIVNESIYFEFGKKDIWKVTHEITLENKGNLLYHTDRSDSQPLLFSLFSGGFDLSYLEGVTRSNSKIDDEKDTLQVFTTLPPQQTTKLKFSYYYLPLERHVPFDRVSFLQRSNVTLYFKDNVRIASTQFQSDPMMLKGKEGFTRAFTSGPIKMNDKITFDIKGFFLQGDLLHIFLLAACLALVTALIVWAFKQKRKSRSYNKQLTEKMERYLIELKKLHKEGKLDDSQYKKDEQRVRNFLFQVSKPDLL